MDLQLFGLLDITNHPDVKARCRVSIAVATLSLRNVTDLAETSVEYWQTKGSRWLHPAKVHFLLKLQHDVYPRDTQLQAASSRNAAISDSFFLLSG